MLVCSCVKYRHDKGEYRGSCIICETKGAETKKNKKIKDVEIMVNSSFKYSIQISTVNTI